MCEVDFNIHKGNGHKPFADNLADVFNHELIKNRVNQAAWIVPQLWVIMHWANILIQVTIVDQYLLQGTL